jgi:hypothetical protein
LNVNRVAVVGPVPIRCARDSGGIGNVHGGEAFGLVMAGKVVGFQIRFCNDAVCEQQQLRLGTTCPTPIVMGQGDS